MLITLSLNLNMQSFRKSNKILIKKKIFLTLSNNFYNNRKFCLVINILLGYFYLLRFLTGNIYKNYSYYSYK